MSKTKKLVKMISVCTSYNYFNFSVRSREDVGDGVMIPEPVNTQQTVVSTNIIAI